MEPWHQHFANNESEVFWVRDIAQRRMIFVSAAYELIWGDSLENIYSDASRFLTFIHPEDVDRVRLAMEERLMTGGFNEEYRIVRPDGEMRWIYARSFPVFNKDGEIYRVAGTAEDITARKRDEELRLLYEREQREILVREVHHRIKNNLQGIVGLLRQQLGEYAELENVLSRVISQVQSIAVIHGLQGQSQLVYLCEIVQAIGLAVSNLYHERSAVDIRIETTEPLLLGEEDAVPIALIINELLTNAIKHGLKSDDHPVRLELQTEDGKAVIKVWNRLEDADTRLGVQQHSVKGTGLGLIKSLMPYQGASLAFEKKRGNFEVVMQLQSPVVEARKPGMREPSLETFKI